MPTVQVHTKQVPIVGSNHCVKVDLLYVGDILKALDAESPIDVELLLFDINQKQTQWKDIAQANDVLSAIDINLHVPLGNLIVEAFLVVPEPPKPEWKAKKYGRGPFTTLTHIETQETRTVPDEDLPNYNISK